MIDSFIGEIRLFAGRKLPEGWLICDGQTVNISEHEALHNLIGNIYGGDGKTTFNLPDLRGRVPVGISGRPDYVLGKSAGEESHVLTVQALPKHGHDLKVSAAPATSVEPGSGLALATIQPTPPVKGLYTTAKPDGATLPVALNALSIAPVGGGKAHPNVMPTLAINYIISTSGWYPGPA